MIERKIGIIEGKKGNLVGKIVDDDKRRGKIVFINGLLPSGPETSFLGKECIATISEEKDRYCRANKLFFKKENMTAGQEKRCEIIIIKGNKGPVGAIVGGPQEDEKIAINHLLPEKHIPYNEICTAVIGGNGEAVKLIFE